MTSRSSLRPAGLEPDEPSSSATVRRHQVIVLDEEPTVSHHYEAGMTMSQRATSRRYGWIPDKVLNPASLCDRAIQVAEQVRGMDATERTLSLQWLQRQNAELHLLVCAHLEKPVVLIDDEEP